MTSCVDRCVNAIRQQHVSLLLLTQQPEPRFISFVAAPFVGSMK